MASIDPTKLRIYFGLSSLPLVFLSWNRAGGRDSLDLLAKVKYKEQGGEEDEWRVLESVVNYWLLAIYNQFF